MTPPTGGNVPYRDAAVRALFGGGTPAANINPGFRGRWTGPSRVEGPLAPPLPQKWERPGMEGARLPLNGGRPSPEETRTPPERDRPPAAATVRTPFGAAPIALEGVDPTGSRTPVGQEFNRDAEMRMRIEQGLVARVPPTALAPPVRGLRASPSFGGAGSTHPLGDRRFFRTLVGIGAQPAAIDPEVHDRVMASVSHLPHVFANVLVAQAVEVFEREGCPPAVGPSLRDTIRVAGANTAIWTDIYLANRDALSEAIEQAVTALEEVRAALARADAGALAAWNERARAAREALLGGGS